MVAIVLVGGIAVASGSGDRNRDGASEAVASDEPATTTSFDPRSFDEMNCAAQVRVRWSAMAIGLSMGEDLHRLFDEIAVGIGYGTPERYLLMDAVSAFALRAQRSNLDSLEDDAFEFIDDECRKLYR